ncbi:protein Flattop isoform X1 [Hemicordylus capensis]|uniref:protein Flattop isoform X1 n=1 Tax=Hemicordylus capensis TaxID=884348 RepID=UPI00230204A4|nr:protein Flattop isoform X1 [Hemicordylus capensis]
MATHYSSGQYEDAYVAQKLQNWSLPRACKELPSTREGYTQFIANDRGHLLPSIPRSKASPWGTYVGTWDMPLKIPPAQVNLTCRSVAAAAHLTEWLTKPTSLNAACNGLVPEIVGKPNELPPGDSEAASARRGRPPSKGTLPPGSAPEMPAQGEDPRHRGAATPKGPLSRQPGCIDVRMKEDAPPDDQASPSPDANELKPKTPSEIPLSRQPGSIDVRLKGPPAPHQPSSGEPAPRRAISAEAPLSGHPRSLEGKPKGVSTPELLASHRQGSLEAPCKSLLPEALAYSRPVTKGSHVSEVQKTPRETEVAWSELPQREGLARSPSCPEKPSS